MRAAAILGLGCSSKDLKPFQTDAAIEWRLGMPAAADQAEVILLFGGDGTVHRHLGQLVKVGLPVLIVPAGSGNDFARALELKHVRDSVCAWKRFCKGARNVRSIDLGLISAVPEDIAKKTTSGNTGQKWGTLVDKHYFCCVAGVGLDGDVARRANNLPRWLRGHGGYALSSLPAIFSFAPFPMKVSTANEESQTRQEQWTVRSDRPTTLAAFANSGIYGGGMKIAPKAKMDDGLLDVCVVGGVDPFKLFCMFPTVYAGRHLGIKEVEYFQAARVRVETEHSLDVYADGEFVSRTPVEIGVERAALKVVTDSE